jgi:[acyl-carrier-protein] S-malonyltransferase
MKPAADKLAEELNAINVTSPEITVIHNASVTSTESDVEIKQLLTQQLHSPVRWVETISSFAEHGVTTVVECGPGKVLAGLTKRINKSLVSLPVFDTASLNKALETIGE